MDDRDLSALVQRVANDLEDEGAEAVVLMGSHVRGDALPDSDVDIVAIGEGPPYILSRREGWLLSVSRVTASAVRESFRSPRAAPGVVPGWRSAKVLADANGVAAELREEARRWSWDVVGDDAKNGYVAEEITGLAEEVHKLVNLREAGNMTGAAVQRAILSFRLGVVMVVYHRMLFDSENGLWDMVNERLGELWGSAQSRAFGLDDETFDETCEAALELYRLAAGEVAPVLDPRQLEVVDYASRLSLQSRRSEA